MTGPFTPDPVLVAAARRELTAAETNGPAMVAAGGMSEADLAFTVAAWRCIAALLEHGRAEGDDCTHDDRVLTWWDMETVVRANWMRRLKAVAANQDPDRHAALDQRADAVALVLARLRRARDADLVKRPLSPAARQVAANQQARVA